MAALVTDQELADVMRMDLTDDPDGFEQVADAASDVVSSLLTTGDHSTHPACREAALHVAAEMYQARYSAGGQAVSVDMGVMPSRLSAYLTRRVAALTAAHFAPGAMVG